MGRLVPVATWSSGMIPASGAGGPGFNSRSGPYFVKNRKISIERMIGYNQSFK